MKSTAFRCAFRRAISGVAGLALLLTVFAGLRCPAQAVETYKIQPTDILIVEVVNEPQLTAKEFRVSADGEVSYPFIGAIKVGNRTPTEVQAELKTLLETDYLVSAQVIVQVKEYRKRFISVLGQVMKPGQYEIPAERRWTILDALAAAGGTTRLARTSDIQLNRPENGRAGKPEPLHFREEDLRNPDKPAYVEQGDVIFVPESRI